MTWRKNNLYNLSRTEQEREEGQGSCHTEQYCLGLCIKCVICIMLLLCESRPTF